MNKFWFLIKNWFIAMGSPPSFYKWATTFLPWLGILAFLTFSLGLVWGIGFAPSDYKQGDVYRILFIHVPSAILGQSIYLMMAVFGFISLVWRAKIAGMLLISAAPLGAGFTLVALVTGSIWGKPTWGTWWVWDARLTSMLVLFFFYLGYIILSNAFERKIDGSKSASVLAIIGLINLPIIKFSVDWWHTLHQPSSILKFDGPSIDEQMLLPLILMFFGFSIFSLYLIILNVKTKLIEKKCEALILKSNLKEFV